MTDLNVMTRRKVYRHRATRIALDGEESLTCTGELALLVLVSGAAKAKDDQGELLLQGQAVLALASGEPLVRVSSEARADFVLIELWRR